MGLLKEAQQEAVLGRMIINVLGEQYTRYACVHETKAIEAILKCVIKFRGGKYPETCSIVELYSQYREGSSTDVSDWSEIIEITSKVKADYVEWQPVIDTFLKLETAYNELFHMIDSDIECKAVPIMNAQKSNSIKPLNSFSEQTSGLAQDWGVPPWV